MQIFIYDTYEEVSQKACQIIVDQIKSHPHTILGLATGSTPLRLYELLVESNHQKLLSFKNVITYNLDEYIGISRNHPQSYYHFMKTHLFSKIDIKEENIHIPNNQLETIFENVNNYNEDLRKHTIDIQILGIGTNGHIGFNEPKTHFGNETLIVELNEQTRKDNMRFFNSLDEVPKQAITMGIKNIMKSKQILLMASGKEKANALYQMIHRNVTEELPASILQLHPSVIVILDRFAASRLLEKDSYS